jgi:hypothetical protein
MRKRAYLQGREVVWPNAAHRYVESFTAARRAWTADAQKTGLMRLLGPRRRQLPKIRLTHLARMTDSTGLLQHSTYVVPSYSDGYCTDDNARALLLTVMLEAAGEDSAEVERLVMTYAAFLQHAYDPQRGRFRNLMAFDRHWDDNADLDDAHARALWAIGACVGRSRRRGLQTWALQTFEKAALFLEESTHPRAWALGLLAIHEYLRRLGGDRTVTGIRRTLMARLMSAYERHSSDEWRWFEKGLTYDNAKLPHALVLVGQSAKDEAALRTGLEALRWLVSVQTAEPGHFRPIGSDGFYPRGGHRADFDQQPLEAHSTLSACVDAYRVTHDAFWLDHARRTFDWFMGRNDLGLELYDATTGGCRDGLHADRVNENQGAESTLAFLLSLTELRVLESSLAAFARPRASHPPRDELHRTGV